MPYKDNLCFIHIPKCAGSSIEHAMDIKEDQNLKHGKGKRKFTDVHDSYVFQVQHLTLKQLNEFKVIDTKSMFKFTFVRNPFERMVSEYAWCGKWFPHCEIYGHERSTKKGWDTFEEFLEFVYDHVTLYNNTNFIWCHFAPQSWFIKPEEADFIGKVENFKEDLQNLSDQSGFTFEHIHVNKRGHKPYQQMYNNHTAELVRKMYQQDFETFGYDKLAVISHFKEDVAWAKELVIPYVIYTKGDTELDEFKPHVVKFGPNLCREASSYTKYIIDNYYTLPDHVCFLQGSRTSWHNDDLVDILRRFKWGTRDYININHNKKYYRSGILLENTKEATCKVYQNSNLHRPQIWEYFFKELGDPPADKEWYTYGCAQFVVKKDAIMKHSKQMYVDMYEKMMKCEIADSYYTSLIFEHMWGKIFGPLVALEPKIQEHEYLNGV